jgi:hypothetical protein
VRGAGRRVEPLYLEQYRRWRAERPRERAPTGLRELVEARINELEPAPRRVLQALAIAGPVSAEELAALIERPEGIDEAIRALGEAGFVVVRGEKVRMAHALHARVALENAPAGVVDHLHARAAEALAAAPADVERRAYHLIRARPTFETFVLLEKCVRLRTLRGDVDGVIAALSDGYSVARTCAGRGEADADGWHVFGRKLAVALRAAGRASQARGVLLEVLQSLGPADWARAPVLEELASLAVDGGRTSEAERWTREANDLPKAQRTSSGRLARVRGATDPPRGSTRPAKPKHGSSVPPGDVKVRSAVRVSESRSLGSMRPKPVPIAAKEEPPAGSSTRAPGDARAETGSGEDGAGGRKKRG